MEQNYSILLLEGVLETAYAHAIAKADCYNEETWSINAPMMRLMNREHLSSLGCIAPSIWEFEYERSLPSNSTNRKGRPSHRSQPSARPSGSQVTDGWLRREGLRASRTDHSHDRFLSFPEPCYL